MSNSTNKAFIKAYKRPVQPTVSSTEAILNEGPQAISAEGLRRLDHGKTEPTRAASPAPAPYMLSSVEVCMPPREMLVMPGFLSRIDKPTSKNRTSPSAADQTSQESQQGSEVEKTFVSPTAVAAPTTQSKASSPAAQPRDASVEEVEKILAEVVSLDASLTKLANQITLNFPSSQENQNRSLESKSFEKQTSKIPFVSEQPVAPLAEVSPRIDAAPPVTGQLDRKPLSSFRTAADTLTHDFRPCTIVSKYLWPRIVNQLVDQYASLYGKLTQSFIKAAENGKKGFAIVGQHAQLGTTTTTYSVARLLAKQGFKVAIVEANFQSPSMIEDLHLPAEHSWEDVLSKGVPVAEAVVGSTLESISILPLRGYVADSLKMILRLQTAVTAGVLQDAYDITLVDLGALANPHQLAAAQIILESMNIQGAVLLTRAGHTMSESHSISNILGKINTETCSCLGLVEVA